MAKPVESLFTYMVRHHAQLETSFQRLLEAMAVDAPDVRALWTDLDRSLTAHMEAEERFVLPAFARVDRREAVELLREHGEFRELLLELGVAVDLHQLRFERSEELVRKLRSHAAREDNLLYRWADAALDEHLQRSMLEHAGARPALSRVVRAIHA